MKSNYLAEINHKDKKFYYKLIFKGIKIIFLSSLKIKIF